MPCVITGFEAIDMLIALIQILKMIKNNEPKIVNEYSRVVKQEGNKKAQLIMREVFEAIDANWRGIGLVKKSGLAISKKFQNYDSFKKFKIRNLISSSVIFS